MVPVLFVPPPRVMRVGAAGAKRRTSLVHRLSQRREVPDAPAPEVLVALGHAVRALRQEGGFSQERVAEGSGLSARYISDVEHGRRNVGMVNIDRIARALSVDLPTLMAGVEAQRRF